MQITITLTDEEQAAFQQVLDAALRHLGVGALDVAAHFKAKLVAAVSDAKNAAA